MPESLLSRRLKLGTYLGIGLYVHWSFSLAIAYVALLSWDLGAGGIAFAVAQLLGVFFCVTLHEYGHAMAARMFGIGTADITLLPIGGVARLRRMPRIPWQELIVAVAGPAVNVAILVVLAIGFWSLADPLVLRAFAGYAQTVLYGSPLDEGLAVIITDVFSGPSLMAFALTMVIVNAMLILFNMIPAFPMDGGRVFRSLLAMGMAYTRATSIASKIGLVCAGLMAYVAITADPPHPVPILIAVFIGYAGLAEARQVNAMESVRGLRVRQVMVHSDLAIPMNTPLSQVVRQWQSSTRTAIPVVSIVGTVVGMLRLKDVIAAVSENRDPATPAGELVDHRDNPGTIRIDDELSVALTIASKDVRQIPVVDFDGRLAGVLDLDSMLARRGLPSPELGEQSRQVPRFDAST